MTIIPISSKTEKRNELDIILPKTEKNRLMHDSLLKIQQISSFDKMRFVKYIGICDDEIFNVVKENICLYLAI